MFEILSQLFWWAVLIVSVPSLAVAVIALPVFVLREQIKEVDRA